MQIVLYKRRWFILLVCSLINLTNAMSFITFAPISSFTIEYYRNSYAPILFNIVFMIVSPVGFFAMFIVSKRNGLRTSCLLCAWMNFIGNILRLYAASPYYSLFFDRSQSFRFWITLLGQTLSALVQPFGQYLPSKLAADWFPDSQRVVANACGTLSAQLGLAVIFALSPAIVNTSRPDAFFLLNAIITFPATLTALLSLAVTSSHPPSAPSLSAAAMLLGDEDDDDQQNEISEEQTVVEVPPREQRPSLMHQIGHTLRYKAFMLLNVMMGIGFGISNSLNTNLQQVLCSKGYPTEFAGTMGLVPAVVGLSVAPLIGFFVDRTHLFEEIMKVLTSIYALSAIALMALFQMQGMEPFLLIAATFFGIAGTAIFPIGLELGVETTYPISTSVSNGVLVLLGQVVGMLFLLLTTFLQQPPTPEILAIQTCVSHKSGIVDGVYDWKLSFMVWAGFAALNTVFFVIAFRPKYLRLEYERECQITSINQEDHLVVGPSEINM